MSIPVNRKTVIAEICAELQSLQRKRAVIVKSRIMQANRLQAVVAGTLGYLSSMKETERTKKFQEALAVIDAVANDKQGHSLSAVIKTTLIGIEAFDSLEKEIKKEMVACANTLPIKAWVELPEQRGFGLFFLAIVIGETGDLSNYANPAKVWRRLGCAPWTFNGKTQMGATWRSGKGGKLPAEEWERFGYSPRRRSLAYLIGEGIVKLNKGSYRTRYDEAKEIIQASHSDYSKLRCHRHGMLLATKLLLKNLWIEWNKQ